MKPFVVSGQEQITANPALKSITIAFIIYILGLILWAIATTVSRNLWSDRKGLKCLLMILRHGHMPSTLSKNQLQIRYFRAD